MSPATLAPAALQLALDVERVAPLVEPLLAPGAALATCTLLDRKEGRALLSYGLMGPGAGRPASVMAKLYSDLDQAERVEWTMRRLAGEVFASVPGLTVPRPLGVVPQLALLVYEPAEGTRLDLLPEASAIAGAREAARWLAELHGSSIELDRRLDLAHEVDNAGIWAALAARRLGPPATGLDRLVAGIEAAQDQLVPAPEVPIHKDFHHAHVLVGRDVAVVDLDEARMGDVAFDVAHFCANVRLMGPGGGSGAALPASVEEAFRGEYAERTGWAPNGRFAFFYALNCVKLVKQIATGRGPAGRLEGPERDERAARVVEEGLAWLTG